MVNGTGFLVVPLLMCDIWQVRASVRMSDSGLDTLVFVYGTLKTGEPNHHWLKDARGRSSFLGPGLTLDTWPLVVVTEYNIPMLLGKAALTLDQIFSEDKHNYFRL